MRKTCLDMVYELAKKDKRIFFIGSDLGAGTLEIFKKEMPDRFLMEGVSEANMIGIAAGLAKEGKIVYVNTIATFITRRCFEQNVLELGLHKLKVRLIGNGAGLVYAPLGPTHLAIDDIAIMRTIPNMAIVSCADATEIERLMPQTVDYPGPIYIRLARGGDPIVTPKKEKFEIGKGVLIRPGVDVLLITTGITLQIAKEVSEKFKNKLDISILHLPTLKPLDSKLIVKLIKKISIIITIEEHSIIGGLGSCIAEIIAAENYSRGKLFQRISLPDVFPKGYGTQKDLMQKYGISVLNVIKIINKLNKIKL